MTNYKKKPSPTPDSDNQLPDTLNIFYGRFEQASAPFPSPSDPLLPPTLTIYEEEVRSTFRGVLLLMSLYLRQALVIIPFIYGRIYLLSFRLNLCWCTLHFTLADKYLILVDNLLSVTFLLLLYHATMLSALL